MRKVTMALALLAVVAMAGTSFAGTVFNYGDMEVIVEKNEAFTYANLDSYMVKIGGAAAFGNISIAGIVSQSTKFELLWDEELEIEYEAPVATPWNISMPTAHKAVDTHFMFGAADVAAIPGTTFSETNDKSNPAGVSVVASYYAGLGTFSSNAGAGIAFGAPLAAGTDFMQVVVPTGSTVYLNMLTPINGVDTPVAIPVGIPEPGTVMLLIAGALCLAVARFRK